VALITSGGACGSSLTRRSVSTGASGGDRNNHVQYGAGVSLPDSAGGDQPGSAAPRSGSGASGPGASAAATSKSRTASPTVGVANRSDRDDSSGFHLTLVVDGATKFRTSDDFLIEITATNTTDHVLHYDTNQTVKAAIASRGSSGTTWTDQTCRAGRQDPSKPTTGLLDVAPGENVRLVARYPAVEGADSTAGAKSPDSCRLPAGDYWVAGRVDYCPEAEIVRSDYNGQPYCPPERVAHITTAALAIRLDP